MSNIVNRIGQSISSALHSAASAVGMEKEHQPPMTAPMKASMERSSESLDAAQVVKGRGSSATSGATGHFEKGSVER